MQGVAGGHMAEIGLHRVGALGHVDLVVIQGVSVGVHIVDRHHHRDRSPAIDKADGAGVGDTCGGHRDIHRAHAGEGVALGHPGVIGGHLGGALG